MKEPILITGCARSGTSMTAGIIHLCGAFGGDMFGPTKYNRRGMYENRIIREGVLKAYLRTINADPLGQSPLPDMNKVLSSATDPKFVGKWRNTILGIISGQGATEDHPWFYKGAKMALIWPIWHQAFPGAKWVLVRRSDKDIINSCLRTAFMRAFRTADGWQKWIDFHKVRFKEMSEAKLNIFEIWPEKAIAGDLSEVEALINWLGFSKPENIIEEFINPVFWGRNKR